MPTTIPKKQESEFACIELSPLERRILEEVKQSKIEFRDGRYEDVDEFFKKFEKKHNIK